MKNSILVIASTLFLTVTILSGCQSSATKVENAEDKVQDAKNDLADSQRNLYAIRLDTISNYEQFKLEAEKILIAQEKNIADLKARLASEKKVINVDYDKKLWVFKEDSVFVINNDRAEKLNVGLDFIKSYNNGQAVGIFGLGKKPAVVQPDIRYRSIIGRRSHKFKTSQTFSFIGDI